MKWYVVLVQFKPPGRWFIRETATGFEYSYDTKTATVFTTQEAAEEFRRKKLPISGIVLSEDMLIQEALEL